MRADGLVCVAWMLTADAVVIVKGHMPPHDGHGRAAVREYVGDRGTRRKGCTHSLWSALMRRVLGVHYPSLSLHFLFDYHMLQLFEQLDHNM